MARTPGFLSLYDPTRTYTDTDAPVAFPDGRIAKVQTGETAIPGEDIDAAAAKWDQKAGTDAATQAEVDAGAAADKSVTPATLQTRLLRRTYADNTARDADEANIPVGSFINAGNDGWSQKTAAATFEPISVPPVIAPENLTIAGAAPTAGDGDDGDYWIDNSTARWPVYGPKAAGAWPAHDGTSFVFDASAIKVKYYGATAARDEAAGEPNQGLTFVDLAVGFPAGTPGDAIIIRDSGITSNGAFGQDVVTGDVLERQEAGITPPWRRIVQGIEDDVEAIRVTADINYNTNNYTDQSATTLLIDGTGHSFRISNNSHLTLLRVITADGTVTDTVQPALTAFQIIPLNADGIYDVWRTGDELTIQENQDIVRRSEVDVITSGLSDEITTRTAGDVALTARLDALPPPFSGNYSDLTNQPAIPQVSTDADFTNDPTSVTDRATLKTALDSLNLGKWLPEVADIANRDALTGVVENDKIRVTDAGSGLWANYQATQDNPAPGDWQIISEEGAQVPPLSEADAIDGTATTDSSISASTLSATIAARLYYDIRETYGLNQRVYDPASGNYFQSLQAGNINHPLNDAAWWEADLAATTDYIRNLGPVATLTDVDLAAKFPVGDESRPLDIITVGDVAYQMRVGTSNPQVASSWEPVSIPGTRFINEITVPIRSAGTNASAAVSITFFDRNGNSYAPSNFVMNGTLTQYAGGTAEINFNDTPFVGNIGLGHNKAGAVSFSWSSELSLMNGLSRVDVVGSNGGSPNGPVSGSFVGTSDAFSHPVNAAIVPPEEFTSQTQITYDDNPDLTVNTGVGMTRQGLQSLFGDAGLLPTIQAALTADISIASDAEPSFIHLNGGVDVANAGIDWITTWDVATATDGAYMKAKAFNREQVLTITGATFIFDPTAVPGNTITIATNETVTLHHTENAGQRFVNVERNGSSSSSTQRTFDSLGDTDDEAFTDGETVNILYDVLGNGPPSIYQFEEAAADGHYEISGPPAGYLNRVGSVDLLTQVLTADSGLGTQVTANFNQANQGGGEIDLLPHYRNYLVRRHPASLDVQSFDSGGVTLAVDDFDWHWFRRIDANNVEYLGKPFAGSASAAKNALEYPVGNFVAVAVNDAGTGADGAVYKIPNIDALQITLPNKADMDAANGFWRVRISGEWADLAAQTTLFSFIDDTTNGVDFGDGLPDSGNEWIDLVLDLANERWIATSGGDVTLTQVVPTYADNADVPANVRLWLNDGTGPNAEGLYRKETVGDAPNYVG